MNSTALRSGLQSARALALQTLLDCRQSDAFAQEILDVRLAASGLQPADRRLVTQLTYGVLRRRGTLDALLRPLVKRQPHQVETWLWEALRLGAYQLALLTQIPTYAALNETVELATNVGRPGSKGFLNGVLRTLSRLLTSETVDAPAADALPLEAGHYRKLAGPVLPDPAAHPLEYLAQAFALPDWLAERWLRRYPWEECVRQAFWFAGPAPLWLRCNRLRIDRDRLLKALADAGVAAAPGDVANAVRIEAPASIRELPGYDEGWFSVQDESAVRVAVAVEPKPGDRILDMCAAPGGKTTHLAELMDNCGQIVACDVDHRRLQKLDTLCQRLRISIVEKRPLGAEEEPPAERFDAVLVDAPCSNTGVLGRRPEARWRLRPEHLERLMTLQTKLLLQAIDRVRLGGRVVYATCSVEPEENRNVVRRVVGAVPGWAIEAEEEQVPGQPADGGYWARLRKS